MPYCENRTSQCMQHAQDAKSLRSLDLARSSTASAYQPAISGWWVLDLSVYIFMKDKTYTIRSTVLNLVYTCSFGSMVAVIDERPWFKGHHGDTVLCWMHFLAARPQHAKSSFRFGVTYRRIETFWTFAPSVRRFLRSETSET
jgi:hypothetical protein